MADKRSRLNLRETFGAQVFGKGLSLKKLYLFSLHLSLMTRCGISLVDSLEALGKQNDEESAICASMAASDLDRGLRLSEALRRQPESFSESYIGVIQAAEQSGTLESSLEQLTRIIHRQHDTRQAMNSALMYPMFLMLSCSFLIVVMLYFVFPMVIAVTAESNAELPAATAFLVKLSSPQVGLSLLLLLGLCFTLFVTLKRSKRWREPFQRRFERGNLVGRFFVRLQLLESLRQLSALLSNGVDFLRAIELTTGVSSSSVSLTEAFHSVRRQVSFGVPFSDALRDEDCFPPMLADMIAVSSEVGKTPEMIDHYCSQLEDEIDYRLQAFRSALEPIMMGVLGTVVGFILIAAFMPIYNLVQV